MADDASYISFLNKANQDPKAGASTSQSRSRLEPTNTSSITSGSDLKPECLPASLQKLPEILYTSDTDAPFEAVVFNYASSSLPSVSDFENFLGAKAKAGVVELSVEEFDPRGQYKEIIHTVEQAGNGDGGGVKVFRVEISTTHVEYYVLTVGERMLVGVVAKAVES